MATTVTVVTVTEQPIIRFRLRMAFAIFGTVVGYSVAICLGGVFHNPSTAAFAALSGILANICLVVHWKAAKQLVGDYPDRLRLLSVIGAVFGFIGVAAMATFIGLAAWLHQGLYGRGNGYYLTSIWCFMTAKWGLLMLFYTRQYLRLYCGKYRPDTTPLING